MKQIMHIVNGTIIYDDGYAQRVKRQLECWSRLSGFNLHVVNFLNWRKLFSFELIELVKKTSEYLNKLQFNYVSRLGFPLIAFFYNPDLYFKYCAKKMKSTVQKENIDLVYAENLMCGYMAYHLKQKCHTPYIMDYHGVAPEEFELSGRSFYKVNYEFYKKMERKSIENADGIVCVSNAFKRYILENFNIPEEKIYIIPSCIQEDRINFDNHIREEMRDKLNVKGKKVIIYAGGIGLWHCSNEMILLFRRMLDIDNNFYFIFLTHDANKGILIDSMEEHGIDKSNYLVDFVNHDEVYKYYMAADIGLVVRKDSLINKVSSPTKIAEYLSMGLTLLSTDNIGDVDDIPTNKILLSYENVIDKDFDFTPVCRDIEKMASREENYIKCKKFLYDNYVWEQMKTKYLQMFD
jgi:glycosyltransferase involved in cell wall biosynthesis